MEMLDAIMKWVVAPVAGFVVMMYRTQQIQQTEIAVLKAEASANKTAHEREFLQLQDSLKMIFSKLSSIEEALRE